MTKFSWDQPYVDPDPNAYSPSADATLAYDVERTDERRRQAEPANRAHDAVRVLEHDIKEYVALVREIDELLALDPVKRPGQWASYSDEDLSCRREQLIALLHNHFLPLHFREVQRLRDLERRRER